MKKVLFLMQDLGAGGAERVLVNLVNHMDHEEYEITVLTLFDDGVNALNLSPKVRYISMHFRKFKGMRILLQCMPKRWIYNHYVRFKDYDVIVAYMTGIPTLIAVGSKQPKIAWLHGCFGRRNTFSINFFLKYFGMKHCYD